MRMGKGWVLIKMPWGMKARCMWMKDEITCKCGWRVRLCVVAYGEWDAMCYDMERWIWNETMHLHEEVEGGVKWNMTKFLEKNLQLLQNEEKLKSKQAKHKTNFKRKTYLWQMNQTFFLIIHKNILNSNDLMKSSSSKKFLRLDEFIIQSGGYNL